MTDTSTSLADGHRITKQNNKKYFLILLKLKICRKRLRYANNQKKMETSVLQVLGAKHDKESLEKMVDPKLTNFVIILQDSNTLNTTTKH